MENLKDTNDVKRNDFTLLFDKLDEAINLHGDNFSDDLNLSKDTINTISYFKDFRDTFIDQKFTYLTRSI
jgi:hypothetical protein